MIEKVGAANESQLFRLICGPADVWKPIDSLRRLRMVSSI